MSLTKLEENLSIIENLPDAPTMESTELKQKFDEGSIKIKDYINETLTVEIDNIVTQIKKDISNKLLEDNKKKYYVGKLIFDTENVNPSTYLGFGTWQLWGQGRVPVGINPNDSDFNAVEKTGGEKTHKLTVAELASHTHTFTGNPHTHTYSKSNSTSGSTTLTTSQIPVHNHSISVAGTRLDANGDGLFRAQVYTPTSGGNFWNISLARTGTGTHDASITGTGGGKGHTHSISLSSTNTGSTTQSGKNSNTGSNTAHNNLQPYITCYIWKRTS